MIRTTPKARTPQQGVAKMLRKREKPCPRPANRRPEGFTVGECVDAVECGCGAGQALTAIATATNKPVGRPHSGKIIVTLRLDPAVVAKFKADGPGWQARMNDALAHFTLSI